MIKKEGWVIWDITKQKRAVFRGKLSPYFEYHIQADKYIYKYMGNSSRFTPIRVTKMLKVQRPIKRRYIYDDTYKEIIEYGQTNDLRPKTFPNYTEQYIKDLKNQALPKR